MPSGFKLALAALLCAAGGPALAADPVVGGPQDLKPVWDGFYVGAFGAAGYGSFSDDQNGDFAQGAAGQIGARVGAQKQFGSVVLGAEADIAYDGLDESYEAGRSGTGDAELDALGSVRGRVGLALNRFQPYLTGGFSYGHVDDRFFKVEDSEWLTGWDAGAGLEVAVSDRVALTFEYLHTDLGAETFFDSVAPLDVDVKSDDARLGLNLRF